MSIATHTRALKTVGVYKVFQMCVQIYRLLNVCRKIFGMSSYVPNILRYTFNNLFII